MRSYSPSPVSYIPRNRPGSDDLLSALVIVLAVAFAAAMFGLLSTIEGVQQQQDATQETILCFNEAGDVTSGEDWKECGIYYVRPKGY
jgi:hypothetical protein